MEFIGFSIDYFFKPSNPRTIEPLNLQTFLFQSIKVKSSVLIGQRLKEKTSKGLNRRDFPGLSAIGLTG